MIGGVFPLELPCGVTPGGSLLDAWSRDASFLHAFGNARSALAWLLGEVRPRRLWLPGFICREAAGAAAAAGIEPLWFDVAADLSPRLEEAALEAGDAVLAVDYFGQPPPAAFRQLAARRRDVLWIEDRAQAMEPGEAWGDVLLVSPRKLLGVADGGLLIGRAGAPGLPAPGLAPASDPALLWRPLLERLEAETANGRWYASYQASEETHRVAPTAMTALSRGILERTAAAPIAAARRRNFAALARLLPDLAAIAGADPAWVPFGFPVRLPDPAAASRALAGKGMFCPRHWASLPSPAAACPDAHRLAATLLTLPCDQRYDEEAMTRLAFEVRRAARAA
ncbi:aspartate aminotransferase family protein [Marinimicrococcus flavescens]|uniref:DegT/DnrJ/EryC1/StrS aminotransferase family protein n=1 Tax=Marinimicrococcus flavescens TaxID=3031815 RepID=A0AAP3XRD5_9PROT|nr:hypothetical protein [Marinimicrococcus flavescens]